MVFYHFITPRIGWKAWKPFWSSRPEIQYYSNMYFITCLSLTYISMGRWPQYYTATPWKLAVCCWNLLRKEEPASTNVNLSTTNRKFSLCRRVKSRPPSASQSDVHTRIMVYKGHFRESRLLWHFLRPCLDFGKWWTATFHHHSSEFSPSKDNQWECMLVHYYEC